MSLNKHTSTALKRFGLSALLALSAVTAALAQDDPSGLWKWVVPARNEQPERTFNLRLKADGSTLTGTILTSNRTNDTFSEVQIRNGKYGSGIISFESVRTGRSGTNVFVTKYSGKFSGDRIEGKIESPSRNGNSQTSDWKAERNTTGQLISGPKVVLKPGYDELGRKIVNETKFKALSVADAEKFLADHPDAVILDLRPADAYAEGHLPHAKNLDVSDEATYKQALAPLDKTKWYLVHSVVGHFRTVRALEYFEANGFEHAAAIDGGYAAWVDAGKPTVK